MLFHPRLTTCLLFELAESIWAGAALDVVEEEPNPPRDLLLRENCIVTPHAAFYSTESLNEMREKSAGIVLDVLLGRGLRNVVNGTQEAHGTGG
jgi:D-3-phosphoglycerate dehydrogenase / 2-oxoglutarate reductase